MLAAKLAAHTHEQMSIMMLHALMKDDYIRLNDYKAGDEHLEHEKDLRFVEELILGKDLKGGISQRRGRWDPE